MHKSIAKPQSKDPAPEQQQPYDNLLKSLFEGQEQEVLNYFLAGAEYIETLDVEVLRPPLRVDRVYKVRYEGRLHILHLEFESGSDSTMAARLLGYHAYFHKKYDLPVISVIVYPFQTTMAKSPLREISGEREILIFHFSVFPLWELSAEEYVREQSVVMYTLLPTMKGANALLLHRAIDRMVEYYKNDDEKLARELRWMGVLLRRADIVPLEDKYQIEERLNMYDDLMERDPKMQRIRAESEAKGRAEGRAEAQTEALQKAVVTVVSARFPALAKLARQKVKYVKKPDALNLLLTQIGAAPDETTARMVLNLIGLLDEKQA